MYMNIALVSLAVLLTRPSLSTALQGKQGVQGASALGRGGSSTSNLIEPTRTTASQR